MPRDIVILFDGTSNQISQNRTNILRLYGALKQDEGQLVFYEPGVGTLGMDKSWTSWGQKAYEIAGMAFAIGLDDNVLKAYRFLVENWTPSDRISIFGFSRGAYSARVLAGFLRALGLLRPHQLNLLLYAYRAYKRVDVEQSNSVSAGPSDADFAELRLYEKTLRARRAVPIHFLGLFDTVATVFAWKNAVPRLQYMPFTRSNSMVRTVRHAVAIDERRSMFQPYLWDRGQTYYKTPWPPRSTAARQAAIADDGEAPETGLAPEEDDAVAPQDFKEEWFAGTHGDVGGGWPEGKSGLAKQPLIWMIDEAKTAGIRFKTQTINTVVTGDRPTRDGKVYQKPDPRADINNSMFGLWPLAEIVPRRRNASTTSTMNIAGWYVPLNEARKIPTDAVLHESVLQRLAERKDYRPTNLPKPPSPTD